MISNEPSAKIFNKPLILLDTNPKYKKIVQSIQKKLNYVIFPLASFYFLFQAVLNFFLVLANLRA